MTATTFEVKPLEWRETKEGHTAHAPLFGRLWIKEPAHGMFQVLRSISPRQWDAFIAKKFFSPEEAISATQTEYSAMLLACFNLLVTTNTTANP